MDGSRDRANWTDSETEALINLWEENLGQLRSHKRNGKVYAAITVALAELGIMKTKVQVHSKIENLRWKYRNYTQKKTTGQGGIPWKFYWKIHSFLGSLPSNNLELVVESRYQAPTVSQIIRSMETGDTMPAEDLSSHYDIDWDTTGELDEPQMAEEPPTSCPSSDPVVMQNSEAPTVQGPGLQPPAVEKRKRCASKHSEISELIKEQRALRAIWEQSLKDDKERQEREIRFQEECAKREQELIDILRRFSSCKK